MSAISTYAVTASELTSVADAIRTAGTTTEPLTFPSGFVSAIGDLGGGGGLVVPSGFNGFVPTTLTVSNGQSYMGGTWYGSSVASYFSGSAGIAYLAQHISQITFDNLSSITVAPDYWMVGIVAPLPSALFEQLTACAQGAFIHCAGLPTQLNLPAIQTLDTNVFNDTNIQSVVIGSNCTSVGQNCFAYCNSLTTVTFLGTPTTIHNKAFNSCSNITDIYVPWAEGAVANAPWGATNATIHYNSTPNAQ